MSRTISNRYANIFQWTAPDARMLVWGLHENWRRAIHRHLARPIFRHPHHPENEKRSRTMTFPRPNQSLHNGSSAVNGVEVHHAIAVPSTLNNIPLARLGIIHRTKKEKLPSVSRIAMPGTLEQVAEFIGKCWA